MYKKTIATILVIFLIAVGVVSPRVIDSFDNLLEKFNFIVPADLNINTRTTIKTYKSGVFQNGLDFKTVSLSKRQAAKLGVNNTVEEDFIVKAQTTGEEQTLYEGYPWNIPFVKGSETDINTLGSETVRVGILDSGISLNDEFADVVRVDLVPDTVYDSLGIYNDVTGHGTGVAGIIAAEKNDKGIIGIAPNVSIYSIRVLDENNEAPISRIIAGIEWAIENDIDVLNMSFGTENYSANLYNAIRRAYESGIVLVASAGNTGGGSEHVTYPARFSEVIAVGSNDQNGQKSDFSPNSTDVDILAPGEYIDCIGLVNGYCVENGTSLAAPQVSAAAALILSADNTKNPEFVKQLLVATANVSKNSRGILDIKNALETLPDFEYVEAIAPAAIPKNTGEIENFEISEDVVVGSWAKVVHEELICDFDYTSPFEYDGTITELGSSCDTSVNNIKLFAKAAYMADYLYGFANKERTSGNKTTRFSPLHAIGYTNSVTDDSRKTTEGGSMNSNYVADTKYLYRLALHFASKSTAIEGKNSMNTVNTQNSNYQILRKIVSSDEVIYEKIITSENDLDILWIDVKGIIQTDIIAGVDESSGESAGWKILGLAAHLAGDAFAHRVRVPISSTTSTTGVFYSDEKPDCFWGGDHEMPKSSGGTEIRESRISDLEDLLMEQETYQYNYVTNGTLCQCYHCLKAAVASGNVEFRDISEKYIDKNIESANDYKDDNPEFYAKRFNVGTVNAVETLINLFNSGASFSIYTFLPKADKYPDYTLKLNGLKTYLRAVGFPFDTLSEDDPLLQRINQLSTGTII